MDKNIRHFFLDVTNMEANIQAGQRKDYVTIEFAGTVTPTLKDRLLKAIAEGNYEISTKKFG